jgi:hypothetical protein
MESAPIGRVNPAVVFEAICTRMVTRVKELGFTFAAEGPPLVRLCECFPNNEPHKAADFIAKKALECAYPDSVGCYNVVSACTGMGSVHVGIVQGLKRPADEGHHSSAVVCKISDAELAVALKQSFGNDEDDKDDEDDEADENDNNAGGAEDDESSDE